VVYVSTTGVSEFCSGVLVVRRFIYVPILPIAAPARVIFMWLVLCGEGGGVSFSLEQNNLVVLLLHPSNKIIIIIITM